LTNKLYFSLINSLDNYNPKVLQAVLFVVVKCEKTTLLPNSDHRDPKACHRDLVVASPS